MDEKDFAEVLDKIASTCNADLYLFSGPVAIKSERAFNATLRRHKKRANALCLTTTYGGSADVAYQLVRAVKRHYPNGEFILFVDSLCKSAGTLIALGADSIVMSDTAELGPLDVQVQKLGEMGEFISGLTPSQALATLRETLFEAFEFYFLNLRTRSQGHIATRMAAEMAVEMAVGSYRPIYQQFDPMRLGENERSVAIARAYGERIKTKNVKPEAIEQLIKGYPSHGFVIDRDKAAELFHNVRPPSDAELSMAKEFRQISEQMLISDAPIIRCLEIGGHEDDENDEHDSDEEKSEFPAAAKSGEHSASDRTNSSGDGSSSDHAKENGGSRN